MGWWAYGPGLVLMAALGAAIGHRLRAEYPSRQGPTLPTVALVWAFYAVHFTLVALAAAEAAWPLDFPSWLGAGVGALLAGFGGAIYLSAAAEFRSLTRMSGLDTTRLVTGGAYRWSRNPQTVGWMLVLVGLGLFRRSGLVLALAALFWVTLLLYLPIEEALLERLYGDEYTRYRRRTRRFFGPPRPTPEVR